MVFLVWGAFLYLGRRWAEARELCFWADGEELCSSLRQCTSENDCDCWTDNAAECDPPKPEPVCLGASGGWNYQYDFVCKRRDDRWTCVREWAWEPRVCSAADRCEDPSPGIENIPGACGGAGGDSGSNDTGVILPGICDAPACPGVGCRNGWHYKTCCRYADTDHSGGPSTGDRLTGAVSRCLNGGCPSPGICVWGTSCPAGAQLTDGDPWGCWHTGEIPTPPPGPVPTGGPTPTPIPTTWDTCYCGDCKCNGGCSATGWGNRVCDSWVAVLAPEKVGAKNFSPLPGD